MQKNKLLEFFKDEIWKIDVAKLPAYQGFLVNALLIAFLSGREFAKDQCPLRASALTLYTLLSIVPVIAMLFGVAKGFGFEKMLKERIIENMAEQDAMILKLIGFAENLLANTQGGVVAGIGVVVLFWTVIKVIANIEDAFNHIWKVEKGRSWVRKVGDYLSLMLAAPILLIVSGSITVFVKTRISGLAESLLLPEYGASAIFYVLNYSPLVIMCLLFTFIFIFMPNTKISYKSGILAGVITGVLYQMLQWGYLSLQIGVSSYNAIYGSFAALPLFLIWLQLGWLIVLFGAEISHIHQRLAEYRIKDNFRQLSFAAKKVLAWQIVHLILDRFTQADEPLNAQQISIHLGIPEAVTIDLLSELRQSRVLSEIASSDDGTPRFQPACDPSLLTFAFVEDAMENRGSGIPPDFSDRIRAFVDIEHALNKARHSAPENRLLKDV
ncbi:MAG: YihY/virulence factor BrkB family protein [Gammaproteobacteria bacterium]